MLLLIFLLDNMTTKIYEFLVLFSVGGILTLINVLLGDMLSIYLMSKHKYGELPWKIDKFIVNHSSWIYVGCNIIYIIILWYLIFIDP
jgi:hypothetical protein